MTTELERKLAQLRQGNHVCTIYDSRAEQLGVAIALIREGLARGEQCLFMPADIAVEEVVQGLAATGVDVEHERARGALRLLTERGCYLQSGAFDPGAMIDFLARAGVGALAEGFAGVQFIGEMSWALQASVDPDRLIEYEALLNPLLLNSRSGFLCQYHRPRFDPALIHDVLRTHPLVILNNLVPPNPYYEPPELVLHPASTMSSEFKRIRVNWWITRLEAAVSDEQERKRAEAEMIINDAPVGIALVAPSLQLRLMNPEAQRITRIYDWQNFRADPDYPRPLESLRPDGRVYADEEVPALRSLYLGERVQAEEVWLRFPNGDVISTRVSSVPVYSSLGQIDGAIVILENRAPLDDLEHLRNEFVGLVSRDLRTPIVAIKGSVTTILGRETLALDQETQELFQMINEQVERLENLADNLLDITSIEAGTLSITREAMDLRVAVQEAVASFRRSGGSQETRVEVPETLPKINGDGRRISQVLVHLLCNAGRFSPPTSPISIQVQHDRWRPDPRRPIGWRTPSAGWWLRRPEIRDGQIRYGPPEGIRRQGQDVLGELVAPRTRFFVAKGEAPKFFPNLLTSLARRVKGEKAHTAILK